MAAGAGGTKRDCRRRRTEQGTREKLAGAEGFENAPVPQTPFEKAFLSVSNDLGVGEPRRFCMPAAFLKQRNQFPETFARFMPLPYRFEGPFLEI